MARTLQEQLDDCDAAIAVAERAQGWSEGRRSKQNANLATLYRQRDALEAKIARASRTPFRLASLSRPGGLG